MEVIIVLILIGMGFMVYSLNTSKTVPEPRGRRKEEKERQEFINSGACGIDKFLKELENLEPAPKRCGLLQSGDFKDMFCTDFDGIYPSLLKGSVNSYRKAIEYWCSCYEGKTYELPPNGEEMYFSAVTSAIQEINKGERRKIIRWSSIEGQTNYQKIAILARIGEKPKLYVATIQYTQPSETKDGTPKVKAIETRDGTMSVSSTAALSQKVLTKGISSLLEKPELIPYIELVYNTAIKNGKAVFSAPKALKLSDEKFESLYGTEKLQRAWTEALAERLGGELNPAEVKMLEKTGCYEIRFVA